MQPRTYLRQILPEIQKAARAGNDELVAALWVEGFAKAPEDDAEMGVLARQQEMAYIWASMVLALRKMPRADREGWLRQPQTRYWLKRLAVEACDTFGPSTPIWMEWRAIGREMQEIEDGRVPHAH